MGDRDSEIAIVIEDTDLIETVMDGQKYMAARFAAAFRRQLFKQHLGLIPPQDCPGPITPAMRPVGNVNEYDFGSPEDEVVAVSEWLRNNLSYYVAYLAFAARIPSMTISIMLGMRPLESTLKYTKSSSTVHQLKVSRPGMIMLNGYQLERRLVTYIIKRIWNWVTSSNDFRKLEVTWLKCLQVSLDNGPTIHPDLS